MNLHPKSIFGEISALGTVLLTIGLFIIGLPAIFLSSTEPVQDKKNSQKQSLETSVSS